MRTDRSENDEFQRTPSPDNAVISDGSNLLACRQLWLLAACWFLDHGSATFPLLRNDGVLYGTFPLDTRPLNYPR